jgi:hypothetical protein
MGSAPRRRYTTGVVVRTGRDWKHRKAFFSRIQDILDLYNLPPIHVLVNALPIKFAWKRGINLNIAGKWTNKLSEEVEGKSTMKLCNRDILKIHDVHPVYLPCNCWQ